MTKYSKQITDSFDALGLNSLIASIYIEIANKEYNISSIARKNNVHRQKIYDALDILISYGLVTKDRYGYQTTSPTHIKTLLKKQTYQTQRSYNDFEEILPHLLTNYFESTHQPEIKIFDGVNKFNYLLNTILDDLDQNSELMVYNESDEFYDLVDSDYFFDVWINKRIKRKVFNKILVNIHNSKFASEHHKDSKTLRITKRLQFDDPSRSCYWIVDNKVVFWDTSSPKAVVIQNNHLAVSLKNQFNFIWGNTH